MISGKKKKLRCGRGLEIKKTIEGDRNTTYFHVVANQRRRKKNHLSVLKNIDDPVNSTKDMLEVATKFYKNLFGYEPKTNIH